MKEEKKELKELNCIIDTIQLSVNINNFKNINKVNKDNYNYVTNLKEKIDEKKGAFKVLKMSLNKKQGYKLVNTLSEYKKEMQLALNELEVINNDEVKIDRIDIAVDTNMNFKNNFKYFLFLFEVITYSDEKSERWFTTNLDTLKNNTIILKDRTLEVCFYDKKEESKGRHKYDSRLEFRFKRVSENNYEKYIDKLINKLKFIENNIEVLEINMSKRLIKLLKEEKNEIQSFSEFVRKYEKFFYTANVLKKVYAESELRGNYNNWLKKFKKTNNINFYSKTEIIDYKKRMIKAIKLYEKS